MLFPLDSIVFSCLCEQLRTQSVPKDVRDGTNTSLLMCCVSFLQIPPQQPMPNFADKGKEKSIDLQNFGLRTDLYKKNFKVGTRLA